MEKVTIKQLLELEIGQELEIQEDRKRFIRVPGGWILENHYPVYETVIPVFIPEPIEPETIEFKQGPIIDLNSNESNHLIQSQANAFNNLVGRFQFICHTLDDIRIGRIRDLFKAVFKEYDIEPSEDSKKAFKIK